MSAELAVALGALVLSVGLAVQVIRLSQKLRATPTGGLYEGLQRLDEDLGAAEQAIAQMQPIVQSLDARMPGAIRNTAIVAYDAYGNQAGHLSRSIALLSEKGDGIVISLLIGRDEARFFTKMVKAGTGIDILSPEEQEAVDRAWS